MTARFNIRDLAADEADAFGRLLVTVYSGLTGFPSIQEQPAYYDMLMRVGDFARRDGARVLVAVSPHTEVLGGVVYFGNMAEYGSGGSATRLRNTSGIRLLGVSPTARGQGVGKALTQACIDLARAAGHAEVILHTTLAMQTAWRLYLQLDFVRSPDLDFLQADLPVFGFRLRLGLGCHGRPPAGSVPVSSAQPRLAMLTLDQLLAALQPKLNPGVFVFAQVDRLSDALQLDALAAFRETEGVTVVVPEAQALRAGLAIGFRAAWITLQVPSDLQAVGLTAAFSKALADAGISCNVMAAVHHDHLFVPADRGEDALTCLQRLSASVIRDR